MCGMKVCTDSCLFGALVQVKGHLQALDIGTGTGLLSLMLAQKNKELYIDGVEIDQNAHKQASQNARDSPWSDRMKIFNQSIQDFSLKTEKKYNLIVSNPPFYPNHYKSQQKSKKLALHNDALSFIDLVQCIDRLLIESGIFWLLLPPSQTEEFERMALESRIYCQKKIYILPSLDSAPIRVVSSYARTKAKLQEKEIIIRKSSNVYSNEFVTLLKEFYLHL